jgi:hypothetical protein
LIYWQAIVDINAAAEERIANIRTVRLFSRVRSASLTPHTPLTIVTATFNPFPSG